MEETPFAPPMKAQGALVEIESARAIQEVQAAMIIAKRFPRDQNEAHTRIMKACERYSLADKAMYAYPRGGKTVTGPSIRLAEVIAQNWQNLEFGVRELSQHAGKSEAEAFAWDMEMNTKQIKTFQVPHVRYTKKDGNVRLTDPRDVYEYVANLGARRMRACILGIIPGDVVEDAVAQCEKTLREGNKKKPIQDRIRIMLKGFDGLGISQAMIEQRLGHEVGITTDDELLELNKIGRSISDNITGREEWFDFKAESDKVAAAALNDKLKADKPTKPSNDIYKATENKIAEEHRKIKAEEEEEKEDQIRKLYKGLGDQAFAEFVVSHANAIPNMEQVYQNEIRASHYKRAKKKGGLLEGKPYPLDAPKEAFEGPNDNPPDETETENEKTVRLVEGARLTESGIAIKGCPNSSDEGISVLTDKCDGIGMDACKSREGCPNWTEYDKQSD